MVIDTDELVAFVRARFDEHEQTALATQTCGCGRCEMSLAWTIDDDGIDPLGVGLRHTVAPGYINPEQGAHIVHNDPARVLRRIEADRRIVDLCDFWLFENDRGIDPCALGVLQLMAARDDGHADYQEAWRP